MEQFDLNDFYRGVSNFWDSISPIIFTHLVVFVVLKWTVGADWHILERLEYYINTERYKRWRKILDEFDLRPKMFLLLVVAVFFYFVLINSVIRLIYGIYPVSIIYSEWDFMLENRNLGALVDIASYGTKTDVETYDVFELKERFLDEYEAKNPERFNNRIGWYWEELDQWSSYYVLSIIFLLLTLALFFSRFRNRKRWKTPYSRFFVLFVFSFFMVILTRYQAEQIIEKRLLTEFFYVIDELHFDSSKQLLSDEENAQIKYSLYVELKDPRPPHFFWLSRYLEYLPFIERAYRSTTDQQFKQWYGDILPP